MPLREIRVLLVAGLLAAAATACGGGQDPGVELPTSSGPTTTSRTLEPCPSGGPDATTPAAGCLDGDGNVQLP